ncbi:MAG: hypothetical protein B0D92_00260 [Spirochaeta sp. LUC14_002_19_P3]|nr:MAG: hypothetical protein B0D92_00260 [Spirochaeta sp. LUC14_002_19_P3]
MNRVGIEKLNIYGCSMFVDQRKLALARDKDPQKVIDDYLIETRSLNPLWEDTVTMGANAAKPMLEGVDTDRIGMLIAGTEGAVDFGKPISTNLIGALGLNKNIRNYEVKHACYSGLAALDTAVNWVASGLNGGRTALVIAADFSREHLNLKEEFVLGGVGAALLISNNPEIVEFEPQRKGTWSIDVYDTWRPSALGEVGNNEVSLYSYMDALEGAWEDYTKRAGSEADFDRDHRWLCYHTPFPGMAFQAHRTLCNLNSPRKKAEVQDDFRKRVLPVLRYSKRMGSTYGSSNFVGTASLLSGDAPVKSGDRIGYYAYGSGAIGEFWSGRVLDGASKRMQAMNIDGKLDCRREASVQEYEEVDTKRSESIEQENYVPDRNFPSGLWDNNYQGKDLLTLAKIDGFVRHYEWS